MKPSSTVAVALFVALACAAAGCGGRGGGFTPQAPSLGTTAQTSSGIEQPVDAITAAKTLHGPFYVVTDPGYVPWGVVAFSSNANGDAAPVEHAVSSSSNDFYYPQDVAVDAHGLVYVGESYLNGSQSDPYAIEVFKSPLSNNVAAERRIEGPRAVLGGEALAVTAEGTIYVANGQVSGNGYITEFAPGANGDVAPRVVINGSRTLLDQPAAVAVGPTGKIYVANLGGTGSPSVTIYASNANGNVAPLDHFTLPLQMPTSIAVDRASNVYVASSVSGGVYVFAPGSHTARAVVGRGLEAFGVAVDAAGYVYVANASPPRVYVYPPNASSSSKAVAVVGGSSTAITDPRDVAVPAFAVAATPAPTPSPKPTPKPTPTPKATPTPTPIPIADEAVYVADLSSKTLLGFTAGAANDTKPLVDISGSNTYFEQAQSAFADAKGNMWVAEQLDSTGSSAVLEFKAGSNGNVAPIRRIYGQGPNGAADVVVDNAGNIYVLETNESQIAVFAPTANGQANPVRTITSSYFNGPYSLALDPAQKNLYVTNTTNGVPTVLIVPTTARGSVTPKVIYSSTYAPSESYNFTGISFDRYGDVYVGANPVGDSASAVFVFLAGKTGDIPKSETGGWEDPGISQPTGVGVDSKGYAYVANYPNLFNGQPDAITVYEPGKAGAVRTITNAALRLPGILRVGPYVK